MSKLKRKRIGRAPKEETPEESAHLPEVLYVEDERENWEITELMMRPRFHLTQAATDRAVFDLLREAPHRFEAILMDIQLRGSELDGIAITRALRGHTTEELPAYAQGVQAPKLPIVFVTAYSGRYTRQELLDAGGDELVTKPVDFVTLTLALSRIISRRACDLIDSLGRDENGALMGINGFWDAPPNDPEGGDHGNGA